MEYYKRKRSFKDNKNREQIVKEIKEFNEIKITYSGDKANFIKNIWSRLRMGKSWYDLGKDEWRDKWI